MVIERRSEAVQKGHGTESWASLARPVTVTGRARRSTKWHEVGQAVEKLAGREVDDAVLSGAGDLAPAARSAPLAAVMAGQRDRGRSRSRGCRSGDTPATPPRRASGPASRRGCQRRAGFPARSCQRGSSTPSSRRVPRPAWPWRASPLGWASTWNDGREWRRPPGRDRRPDAVGGPRCVSAVVSADCTGDYGVSRNALAKSARVTGPGLRSPEARGCGSLLSRMSVQMRGRSPWNQLR